MDNYQKKNVVIGMFFTLLLLLATMFFSSLFRFTTFHKSEQFWLTRFTVWICLIVIYLFVNQVEKNDFLIWKEQKFTVFEYLKSFINIMASILFGAIIIGITLKFFGANIAKSAKIIEVVSIMKNNFPLLIFTCLTAGITEELIFRGYLMPRIALFYDNKYSTIVISSLLFGLMHIGYGTVLQIVGPTFIGLIFAIHYQKFRNIKILIFCHFFWDFMMLMVASNVNY